MAYGSSQARGVIGTVAAGLCQSHSNTRSSLVCDLHHSSRQRRMLNPLSEARDRTRNLIVPCQICFHCTTTGNSSGGFLCALLCTSLRTSLDVPSFLLSSIFLQMAPRSLSIPVLFILVHFVFTNGNAPASVLHVCMFQSCAYIRPTSTTAL